MRVLVVEDSAQVRGRLCALLAEQPGVHHVDEAESGEEAQRRIAAAVPQVVVLDLNLVGCTGLTLLGALRAERPDLKVVVLTNHATAQYRKQCTDLGATAFFDKSTEFERAVELVAGLAVRPPPS